MNSKALQQLQMSPQWTAMEQALQEYLLKNFVEGSAKRANEFDTMWDLAVQEGGKYHLQNFFSQLEQEAHKV